MDPEKKPEEKTGFEALLHQNEIAEAKQKAENPQASIEERIRATAPLPKNSVVRNIRTLKDDIAENVAKGNITMVTMASTAQSNSLKKGVDVVVSTVRSNQTKKIALILLAIVLILAGASGLGYVFLLRQNNTVTVNQENPLIFVENTHTIDTTGVKPDAIRKTFIKQRDNADGQIGTMLALDFTKQASTTDGKISTIDLTTDDLFRDLELNAPSRIVRSLDQKYLIGVHIFDGNQPFFIFKLTLYESAFAGMLDWEKTMADDLGPLLRDPTDFKIILPPTPSTTPAVATTTSKTKSTKTKAATSTPVVATSTPPTPPSQLTFEDVVYKNIDTRVLRNQAGKPLIVYAFVSRDTLVITSNLDTLGEIMNRLTSRQVVQ